MRIIKTTVLIMLVIMCMLALITEASTLPHRQDKDLELLKSQYVGEFKHSEKQYGKTQMMKKSNTDAPDIELLNTDFSDKMADLTVKVYNRSDDDIYFSQTSTGSDPAEEIIVNGFMLNSKTSSEVDFLYCFNEGDKFTLTGDIIDKNTNETIISDVTYSIDVESVYTPHSMVGNKFTNDNIPQIVVENIDSKTGTVVYIINSRCNETLNFKPTALMVGKKRISDTSGINITSTVNMLTHSIMKIQSDELKSGTKMQLIGNWYDEDGNLIYLSSIYTFEWK